MHIFYTLYYMNKYKCMMENEHSMKQKYDQKYIFLRGMTYNIVPG